jgi:hypothetical protein
MYRPPTDINGNVLFMHDARWKVPSDYYDTWRTWYGWVHRNIAWTCFRRGDLLVIGPAKRGVQRLSGTPVLFRAIESYKKNLCIIYTQWGIEEVIPAYRLVPIELCEPITMLRNVWLARYPLV